MVMVFMMTFTGLSHLVAASYSEDKYGVVQTTLPSILSCMLSLQEVRREEEWNGERGREGDGGGADGGTKRERQEGREGERLREGEVRFEGGREGGK